MWLIEILDWILFGLSALYAAYLLFFALAAHTWRPAKTSGSGTPPAVEYRSIAVLIPAYAEDKVIMDCVNSFVRQEYPTERFEICVISDHMEASTNEALASLPIRLVQAHFPDGSTKVKALNLAFSQMALFDIAVIMDADNTVETGFLQQINLAFAKGAKIVQAHRQAKSTETPFQVLDALSEEINNTIFRLGHVQAGLSAALIGSGMAFPFQSLKQTLSGFKSIGGFDKELEHHYLREGYRFHYLQETPVYDEKIKKPGAFATQRKRWLSAQFVFLRRFGPEIPWAIRNGRFDFLDKIMQTAMPPRILFLGGTFFLALLTLLLFRELWLKWLFLWLTVSFTLAIAIPKRLWNRKLVVAAFYAGHAFLLMFLTLFRIKGANRRFIHTRHGD